MAESGVRQFESGYLCPDITRLNFLPFAPEQDVNVLINSSGYSGPINFPKDTQNTNSYSGVLGEGTLYPASGSLEQLSRLFWCVKSWTLTVSVNAQLTPVPSNITDPIAYLINGISVPSATYGTINDAGTKNLRLVDIQDSSVNVNALTPQATQGQAIPIDPIMRWDELMCRNKYFSWSPSESMLTGFATSRLFAPWQYSAYTIPFNVMLSQVLPDGTISPPCYGLWSLSIMSHDKYTRPRTTYVPTGKSIRFTLPSGDNISEYNNYFLAPMFNSKTGVLTDEIGQITGYGYLPIPSGDFPLLFYRPTCDGTVENCTTGEFDPAPPNNYFPLIDFQMMIKTFTTQASAPFYMTMVSTVRPTKGWVKCGTFTILDTSLSGYALGTIGTNQRSLFRCPLYTPLSNQGSQLINVQVSPASYWLTSSGTINY